ncbi:unnamed protein product [Owenia fusiformis]|uniref:Homeobox domain-containing protein n=1 Tax=Owenia fusiformis TaxID=6347 RepID=A0A8S4N396_OWEFU|nr:unnamed protein product [Owenia fusiformis]
MKTYTTSTPVAAKTRRDIPLSMNNLLNLSTEVSAVSEQQTAPHNSLKSASYLTFSPATVNKIHRDASSSQLSFSTSDRMNQKSGLDFLSSTSVEEFTITDASQSTVGPRPAENTTDALSLRGSMLEMQFSMLKYRLSDNVKLLELEVFYRKQVHEIECGRYRLLLANPKPHHQTAINRQHDVQKLALFDSVERNLSQLSAAPKDIIGAKLAKFEPRGASHSALPREPLMTSTPAKSSKSSTNTYKVPAPVVQRQRISRTSKLVLDTWFGQNSDNLYPTGDMVGQLAQSAGLSTKQVRKWLSRKRLQGRVNKKLMAHLRHDNHRDFSGDLVNYEWL